MDSIKPFAATLLLALYLPVPFYMLLVHAFAGVWKGMGRASYIVLWAFYGVCVTAVVLAHRVWQWQAWDWPAWVSWTGLLFAAAAAWLAYWTYRTIPAKTLLTFRQVCPDDERRIVRDGALGTIRHPRYLMFVLLALGNLLITGYPLVLVSLAVAVWVFGAVMRLEENELRSYFGEEFEAYKREVPAFFPRLVRRTRD
jgi:protein-S-isoprenylcysteine O-methyltransferase Ste14